jgi:hypothetical protein
MKNPTDANSLPVETVAKLLDLTPRRVQQLVAEGYIPKPERGRYPLVGAVQGYVKHLREQIASAPSSPEEKAVRLRKIAAEAELAELDLVRKRGRVADVGAIIEGVQGEYGIVRERLLSIPGKLNGDLDPEQIDRLTDELHDALDQLHDPDGILARLERDRATVAAPHRPKAAATARPDRVGRPVPARRRKDIGKPGKVAHKRPAGRVRSDARRD